MDTTCIMEDKMNSNYHSETPMSTAALDAFGNVEVGADVILPPGCREMNCNQPASSLTDYSTSTDVVRCPACGNIRKHPLPTGIGQQCSHQHQQSTCQQTTHQQSTHSSFHSTPSSSSSSRSTSPIPIKLTPLSQSTTNLGDHSTCPNSVPQTNSSVCDTYNQHSILPTSSQNRCSCPPLCSCSTNNSVTIDLPASDLPNSPLSTSEPTPLSATVVLPEICVHSPQSPTVSIVMSVSPANSSFNLEKQQSHDDLQYSPVGPTLPTTDPSVVTDNAQRHTTTKQHEQFGVDDDTTSIRPEYSATTTESCSTKSSFHSNPDISGYLIQEGNPTAPSSQSNPMIDGYLEQLPPSTETARSNSSHQVFRKTSLPPRSQSSQEKIIPGRLDSNPRRPAWYDDELRLLDRDDDDLWAEALHLRHFDIHEVLGTGISSTVRRVTEKSTGVEYAVKIIDISGEKGEEQSLDQLKRDTYREIRVLRMCGGHANIIELHDVFETPTFIFLVFEICKKGELFDYLTSVVSLSEKRTRIFMRQLMEAVANLHDQKIVHRDLKPENILLDDDLNIKVSDFGFATLLEDGEELTELCGTPGYLAPEVLAHSMYENVAGYGREVDMWACGVIMYTLLCGAPPFWHRRQMMMLRAIMAADYTFNTPEWDDISDQPKCLIKQLLVVNPAERLTARECLKHPFFQSQDDLLLGRDMAMEQKMPAIRKFKIGAQCVVFIRRLMHFSKQPTPISMDSLQTNPYSIKLMRKVIDTCAFGMYKHWVKRVDNQNRAALFEHTLREDWKHTLNWEEYK